MSSAPSRCWISSLTGTNTGCSGKATIPTSLGIAFFARCAEICWRNFSRVPARGHMRSGALQQVPLDRPENAPNVDVFGHIRKRSSKHENARRHFDSGAAHHLGRRLYRSDADLRSARGAAGELNAGRGRASATKWGKRCFRWIRFSGSSACRPFFWPFMSQRRFRAADRRAGPALLAGSTDPIRQSGGDKLRKYGNVPGKPEGGDHD